MDILLILFGVVLTVGTAIFVAAEFSLVALDPGTIERKAQDGDTRAIAALKGLKKLSLELSSAQVGITLTTILLGYTSQKALANILEGPLQSAGMAQAAATGLAVLISLILINLFSMLFGELVPKNFALAEPLATAGVVAPVQGIFTTLLKPVIVGLNSSANWIIRKFGIEPAEELSGARSATELVALVRRSASLGTLDISTARLLTRSIGIGRLTAVDVMTDRGRVNWIDHTATAADVISLARTTGHSRFPVVGDDLDDIRGFVNLRSAINVPYERRGDVPVTSSSIMKPIERVPETVPLAPLLVQLRDSGQIAIVLDEYGGTSGIVTLEDCVEEVVGEVADEHDPRRLRARFSADGWVIPGDMRPDELAREAGLRVPDDGPFETLAGFIMTELGRLPAVGDEVVGEDVVLTVEKLDGRRVVSVRARAIDPEGTE
ncbi:hemolysin family protein [Flaviflexus equikiangi]|uniref:HlyC/CorC family transporter n=1 Tax=Flaviflexus equikiangi TaxID=2758573 RepID=A0ABS2TFS1_9ACTO|nr:hemolysin family protein [Flaviflexus equikiangi]MBM9433501.1 HlyC/CorC family transporter [Flaviflexus equikiangi]